MSNTFQICHYDFLISPNPENLKFSKKYLFTIYRQTSFQTYKQNTTLSYLFIRLFMTRTLILYSSCSLIYDYGEVYYLLGFVHLYLICSSILE